MSQSLSLPDDLVRRIESKVETGDYASASDVVRDALALLEQHGRSEADKLAWLQHAWREGISTEDIGEFDAARFRTEAQRRLSRKG
jgi:antitoxin ParD1/3/4